MQGQIDKKGTLSAILQGRARTKQSQINGRSFFDGQGQTDPAQFLSTMLEGRARTKQTHTNGRSLDDRSPKTFLSTVLEQRARTKQTQTDGRSFGDRDSMLSAVLEQRVKPNRPTAGRSSNLTSPLLKEVVF